MIISEFLRNLRREGVFVEVDGTDLKVKGKKQALTPESISQLKAHKKEIIAFLNEFSGDSRSPETILKQSREGGIPLSLVQQSYWFLNQLEGPSPTYNMPLTFRLQGQLDKERLRRAIETIVHRHEILRTNFQNDISSTPQQIVQEVNRVELEYTDKSESDIAQSIMAFVNHSFDLESERLFKALLITSSENSHVLVLNMHHIISDGWSLNVIFKELVYNYKYLDVKNPHGKVLEDLAIQYADYAIWQKNYVSSAKYQEQIGYWKNKLDGLPPLLSLPTDFSRPPAQSFRGDSYNFQLSPELSKSLNHLAIKEGTTLFNVLLTALSVLLARFSGSDDIAIGTAIANRGRVELESMIGFFANTIVVRSKVSEGVPYSRLLSDLGKNMIEAYENSDVPFDSVVDAIQPLRSLGVPPVFQVMFRLHNQFVKDDGETVEGLKVSNYKIGVTTAKLDLNFSMVERGDFIVGNLEYATDLFKEASIQRLLDHYIELLENIVRNPERDVYQYDMLSNQEKVALENWNQTDEKYSWDGALHNIFEQQVDKTPNKLAYVFEDNRYSYQSLNEEANQLAHYLMSLGVRPGVRVGLFVRPSQYMGIGTLGIFKAGGVYVPLNPSYPDDRLAHMVQDTELEIILTHEVIEQHLPKHSAKVICLDRDKEKILTQNKVNPPLLEDVDAPAYVLYTSGTTGMPKGILVNHLSFRNMALAHKKFNLLDESHRILQFASISFSISLWGSYMAWLSGATLYQVNDEEAMPGDALYRLLDEVKISMVSWPVSLLAVLPVARMPDSLKTIISTAEPCTDAVVEKWLQGGRRFLNMYGNSEISLGSSLFEYEQGKVLTIGRPFPNTQMYVLDKHMKPLPCGVIGEICTGGIGVSEGYLNREDATRENFVVDPFGKSQSGKLYKTGDLGRYLESGEIQYIGRNDFQVSIRGYRIELQEIEDKLHAHEEVEDVAVVARPDGNGIDRLVCFVVTKSAGRETSISDLRKYLKSKLPNFMVPSVFQQLDKMPLTPNRKVDRLALPQPDLSQFIENQYIAPTSETEIRIADIWCELIGIDKVGVQTDFFEVGGHSLLAAQLSARVMEEFSVSSTVKEIFENPTISELADHVDLKIAANKLTSEANRSDNDETETFEF
ncbi:MAG: amino acid adenylation domain-containing protein [Agarilytica sp.]